MCSQHGGSETIKTDESPQLTLKVNNNNQDRLRDYPAICLGGKGKLHYIPDLVEQISSSPPVLHAS